MARKKKDTKEQPSFRTISDNYIKNLNSIKAFVNNVAPSVEEFDQARIGKIEEIFGKVFEIVGPKGATIGKNRKIEFKVDSNEKANKIAYLLKGLPRVPHPQTQLLYKSSFVMLICYFDFLISDLIHYYYRTYPQNLPGKELTISLSELELCSDVEDARDSLINKKIDSVLYGSLESQKNYFSNDLRINIAKDHINWAAINEAVERRNIIVHNNSIINRRYLQNIDLSAVPDNKKNIKEGREIDIKDKYFNSRIDEFFIAGIILLQNCWRKWKKNDLDTADTCLINVMYEMLLEEKWMATERLGIFSRECKVHNTANRLYLDINYCQSLKWQKKSSDLEKELVAFDVSNLRPKYIIALHALKSDREGFYENIGKAIIVDEMVKENFIEWPLFRELRKDRTYEDRINDAFTKASENKK